MGCKAGKREILCYGIGDFACNGCFTIVSSFLMYFYTDVVKMDLGRVGAIILVSRMADALSCLGMGGLIDRTDTKWGRVRPYLAGVIIPLCLSMIALFYMPDLTERGKAIYGYTTAIIFSVLYSGLSVSYSTMMTCMTKDSKERLGFNLTKNISANLGAFFVTSMTLFLVGKIGQGNAGKGFVGTMCVYGVLYTGIIFVTFWNTKERVEISQKRYSLGESLDVALKNRHWILLCVIEFFMLVGMTMRSQGTIYYAKYCLGQEKLGSVLLSISSFLAVPMMLVVTYLAKKIGKKKCLGYGNLLLFIGLIGMWVAKRNIAMLMPFHVLASIGSGIASGMVFVMIAEVVDYSEYQTGKRPQGFLTSAVSLMMKSGVACAGFLAAQILKWGGYAAENVQSPQASKAIGINYIWLPAIIAVLSIAATGMYTLDEEYPKVAEKLENL